MTRLIHTELLKLWTTRTARIVLALTAAGTAALTVAVLALAGRPGQPALGDDALRQLVLGEVGDLRLDESHLVLHRITPAAVEHRPARGRRASSFIM